MIPANLPAQLGLLCVMQALLLTNNVTLIAVNGLAGAALAGNPIFATLPVTGYVLGAALTSMSAARFMKVRGRRAGYTLGSIFALAGSLLAWHAVAERNMALLVFATFVLGVYNAFGASLRFAAADVADAYQPAFRAKAISLVLGAGIVGGIVGPELSKYTREWLPTLFSGTYLTLSVFAIASLVLAQALKLPESQVAAAAQGPARPLRVILAQPAAWAAVLISAMSYGVMNLVMVATPLAIPRSSNRSGPPGSVRFMRSAFGSESLATKTSRSPSPSTSTSTAPVDIWPTQAASPSGMGSKRHCPRLR